MTRKHAMLLVFASATILVLTFSLSLTTPIAITWLGQTSHTHEAELDAALQDAAATALANRDGAIIVMDAQTGRVRAILNPELAYQQAFMPGSSIKP
ncbi:MAG TPA: hypothetical protein VN659_02290, partial [Pyrinomonadaceae bacterium]|nr:hypothetical protein [Pyrinomonadaceae bacterium]